MTEPPPPEITNQDAEPQLPEPQLPGASPVVRESYLGQVGLRLLGPWGARIGLAWVGLLLLAAVFAPVVASSHPFVWKVNGRVSSPWLEHLTATDVVLLGSFFVAVIAACFRGFSWAGRFQAWLTITIGLTLAAAVRGAQSQWGQTEAGSLPLVLILLGIMAVGLVAALAWLAVASSASPTKKIAVGVVTLLLGGGLWWADIDPPLNVVYSQYREATAAGQVEWQVLPPLAYSPSDYQRDVMSARGYDPRFNPPSLAHPMGTDEGGADVLSRMIYASRIALAIGLIATGIALAIGIVVGGLMGYFSGLVDLIGMRLVEVFSAIPVIYLLIMIVAFYGRNLYLMMVIIGLTGWVGYALFVRAEFLKLRQMDYVQAAHACGVPLRSVLFRHMLPNGVTPVLVLASFGIASAILTESFLSFLGLGLVEEPSWGQMLNQASRAYGQWGLTLFPGLAIFLTVFAYNLIGEALRDALDPKS
jgi:peptide/nickel transport system permease protein